MPKVRFVEGTFKKHDTIYDCEWPVVPRKGEYISITVDTGQVMDWKVTRVCHVASGHETLIGTLIWIKPLTIEDPLISEYVIG